MHAKQAPNKYPIDLHTSGSQLPLWNGDTDCPLQVTLEISISAILRTLMSGPVLCQVSLQSCPCVFFVNFLLQQQIIVMLSQLFYNVVMGKTRNTLYLKLQILLVGYMFNSLLFYE